MSLRYVIFLYLVLDVLTRSIVEYIPSGRWYAWVNPALSKQLPDNVYAGENVSVNIPALNRQFGSIVARKVVDIKWPPEDHNVWRIMRLSISLVEPAYSRRRHKKLLRDPIPFCGIKRPKHNYCDVMVGTKICNKEYKELTILGGEVWRNIN